MIEKEVEAIPPIFIGNLVNKIQMVNDKKYKNFLIIIVVLVLISVGLVAFNFFALKNTPVEYKQFYKLSRDVPAYSELKSDMFEGVTVESDVKLDGMVENLADINGKYANGALSKGEYLTYDSIATDNNEAGLVYTIEIQASFVADIAYDDNVDIYALNKDNSVTLLFGNKKLYRAKTSAVLDATTQDPQAPMTYEAASKLYIRVTKEEMIQYYTSLRDCKLIILPFLHGALTQEELNDMAREQAVFNQSQAELDAQNSVEVEKTMLDYTVLEGDSYDTIAEAFGVDAEYLRTVNSDYPELSVGDTILIPVVSDVTE